MAAPRKIACSCSMPACSISRVYSAQRVFVPPQTLLGVGIPASTA